MEEHTEHRSIRARKPVVYFGDEIAQCPGHSKSSRLPKAPVKPTIVTQPIAQSSASSVSTAKPAVELNHSGDPIPSIESKASAKHAEKPLQKHLLKYPQKRPPSQHPSSSYTVKPNG